MGLYWDRLVDLYFDIIVKEPMAMLFYYLMITCYSSASAIPEINRNSILRNQIFHFHSC